jgi:mRNA interferase RelE/StbE
MYDIVFTKKAANDFDFLTTKIKNRVVRVLTRIRINPYRYLRKLAGTDAFRLRVGDYRIIIDVDERKRTLVILRIGHRKNIYD